MSDERVSVTELSENEGVLVFDLNDNRASAIIYFDTMVSIFDDLVANFADFKVADRYMEYFKSKVSECDDLKARIKKDFEESYNLVFEDYDFYPLDRKGFTKSAIQN